MTAVAMGSVFENSVANRAAAWHHGPVLSGLLSGYQATDETESADLERMTRLAATVGDPWSRALPMHFTASAVVVHPPSGQVLLRWHVKHGRWLQVGGHGDPGETSPLEIALREGAEETGLADLAPWPASAPRSASALRHVVVCHVGPSGTEPAHEHADLRYVLATADPDAVRPENDQSPLRWLNLDEACALVGENNLRVTLERVRALLRGARR